MILKRFTHFYSLFIIIIIFTTCEFEPGKLPLNEIDPPSEYGPPIQITLNEKSDTLKIGWVTDFTYAIKGTDQRINLVKVTFEGQEIHQYLTNNDQEFSFRFDPASYADGKYNLNIEIMTSTGSGSLADKIGTEAYYYKLSWPVVIDKTIPQYSSSFLNAVRTPEGIKLTWNQFNHPNFVSYVVCRYYPAFQPQPVAIATITNPLRNTFLDTTFCEGQDIRYFIRTISPAGFSEGQDIVFFDHLTGLEATWNSDGTALVTWDKAKNLESFGKYYIFSGYRSTDYIEQYLISDPDQNSVRLQKAGFGSGLMIFLKFIPAGVQPNTYMYLRNKSITLIPPPEIPEFFNCFSVINHSFMLLLDLSRLYRYYPDERRTDDILSVNVESYHHLSVSYNGHEFAYYQDEKFYIRSTDDFTLISEFTGPTLKALNRTMSMFSLSDYGYLLAVDSEGYAFLYDTHNGNLIREDFMNVQGYPIRTAALSPDGTKLAVISEGSSVVLYRLQPAGWEETGRAEVATNYIYFSREGASVYIPGYTSFQVRSAEDFSLTSEFQLPGGFFRSVDYDRGRLFCANNKEFEHTIFDLGTGQELCTLILGNSWCWLFNDQLVSSCHQITLPELK